MVGLFSCRESFVQALLGHASVLFALSLLPLHSHGLLSLAVADGSTQSFISTFQLVELGIVPQSNSLTSAFACALGAVCKANRSS